MPPSSAPPRLGSVSGITAPRAARPSTAKARLAKKQEVGELGDDIHNFETMRGLVAFNEGEDEGDDEEPPLSSRRSWAERKDVEEHEIRMEALTERFRGGAKVAMRGTQHTLEPCCVRPVPIRPMSAPVRPPGADGPARTTTSRRSSLILEYWLEKHKEAIMAHSMAIHEMRAEKIRVREERRDARRDVMLQTMHRKRAASEQRAIHQQQPYWKDRAAAARKAERHEERWATARSQDIYFLPPKLAATVPALIKERGGAEYRECVRQALRGVQQELEKFEKSYKY